MKQRTLKHMTSKRRIILHPRTVQLLKNHGIWEEKDKKDKFQRQYDSSAINNEKKTIKEDYAALTERCHDIENKELSIAQPGVNGNSRVDTEAERTSSSKSMDTISNQTENYQSNSSSHLNKTSSSLSSSSDKSFPNMRSQNFCSTSDANKWATKASPFPSFEVDKSLQREFEHFQSEKNHDFTRSKVENQMASPVIHEYKNEKEYLGEFFPHLNSIQSFLYSDEPYKLNSLYQKNLINLHSKKLRSLKVSKRTIDIDIPFYYNQYKQFKQHKLHVKKKLAVVCARELRRALQRTGKTNPNLKGRRIPKLLSQKEKRLKHTNRKKMDLLNEKKREQKKMEYLLGQTELFAHFVLKGDKKEMEKVKKDILLSQNDQSNLEINNVAEVLPLSSQSIKTGQNHSAGLNTTTNQSTLIDHNISSSQNITHVSDMSKRKENPISLVDANISPEEKSTENEKMIETLSLSKVTLPDPPRLSFFKGTLKDYQKKGVSWLINLYKNNINGILADDMGLGKTIQTISLLCYLSEYQNKDIFLIVTPVSTLGNWESEISKFAPIFDINVFTGADRVIMTKKKLRNRKKANEQNSKSQESTHLNTSSLSDETVKRKNSKEEIIEFSEEYYNIADRDPEMSHNRSNLYHSKRNKPKPHIILTSYNLLSDKKLKKIKFDYLVCDEAQAIKSNKSLRWQNINTILSKNRLLLTGTPIQNNLAELWSLLHFIMPTLFHDHNTFLTFFSNEKSVKKETLDRLHLILKPFMLRREKKDVKHELGQKIEKEVICRMTPYQKKIYQSIDSFKDENVVMQLRKIVNHPYLYLKEEITSGFHMKKLNLTLRMRQIDWNKNLTHLKQNFPKNITSLLKKKEGSNNTPDPKHNTEYDILYRDPVEQNRINRMKSRKMLESIDMKNLVSLQESFNISQTDSIVPLKHTEIDNNTIFHTKDGDFTEVEIIERMNKLKYAATQSDDDQDQSVKRIRLQPGEIEILGISSDKPQRNIPAVNFVQNLCRKEENHYLVNKFLSDCTPSVFSSDHIHNINTFSPTNSIHAVNSFDIETNLKCKVENLDIPYTGYSASPDYASLSGTPHYPQSLLHSGTYHTSPPVSVYNTQKYKNAINPVRIPPFSLFDSGKFRVLHQMLKEMRDKRILIYFQMTKMMDLFEIYCKDMDYSFVRLDGQLKPLERKKIVDLFQTQDIFIFMLSTRAGGLGLNLTKANTVIFYDSDWNPTVDQQAMDRAYRLGNKENVTVYRLITADSVENKMRDSAEMKEEIHRLVIDGGEYGV